MKDYQDGFSVNGKANKHISDEFMDAHTRIFGWRCWDCRVNSKGETCDKCKKPRKEVEI